jgi:hypothetical protein
MSAQVQSQPIGISFGRTVVIAVLAFAIGVAGAVAIQTVTDRSSAVEATSSATLWDAGRLEAMEGRVAAASVTQPVVWDSFMSEAMVGRQLAAAPPAPARWDRGMLEAMQGRQLAEADPVVWDSFMSQPSAAGLIGEYSHSQI